MEATRRAQERSQIPVLILTACNNDKTGKQMKDLAPECYPVKPSSREEVPDTISFILQSYTRRISKKSGRIVRDSDGLTGP
jgi:DNA-binding NarL/FixJ family response regulator